MLDDLRQSFAAGLDIPLEDVVVGEDPPDPRTGGYPECLCVIVLRDVKTKLMQDTLRRVLPAGQFTRVCLQAVEQESLADQIRGLSFQAAWDRVRAPR